MKKYHMLISFHNPGESLLTSFYITFILQSTTFCRRDVPCIIVLRVELLRMDRDVLPGVMRESYPWGIEPYIRDKPWSGIVYDGVRRMLNL